MMKIKPSQFKKRNGLTLIELLVAMSIFGLVITIVFSTNLFGLKSFINSQTNAENQFEVRMPTDFIVKKIRFADELEILTSIPSTTLSDNEYLIYLENGRLYYKDKTGTLSIPGTTINNDYKFQVKKAGRPSVLMLTIGKENTTQFDLNTEIDVLNNSNISGANSGIGILYSLSEAETVTPVSIVGVETLHPLYIKVNSSVPLPNRVKVDMSDGSYRMVRVRWNVNTIDTSTADSTVTVYGSVVGWSGNIPLTIFIHNKTIISLNLETDINLTLGTVYVLPTQAVATFDDGTTGLIVIDAWNPVISVIDTNTAVDNPIIMTASASGFEATINYHIVDPITVVGISSTNVLSTTINQGATFNSFPPSITMNMSDGSTIQYDVIWNPSSISTEIPGTYVSSGDIAGWGTNVTYSVNVEQIRIPPPDPPIKILVNAQQVNVKVTNALKGATVKVRNSSGTVKISGLVDSTGEWTSGNIKTEDAFDIVLSKEYWVDSLPVIIP